MQVQSQLVIRQKLSNYFSSHENLNIQPIGGGSINQTYCLHAGKKKFFCKINSTNTFPHLFLKEKNGLERIAMTNTITVPTIIDFFEAEGQQILLLEWIEEGPRTERFWKAFGESLAALHQNTAAGFGLDEDNYMGSVPQSNCVHFAWTDFFLHERLQPMIKRCAECNLLTPVHQRQFENLFPKLKSLFEPAVKSSLLHGDLWSGNFMCNQIGEPVLIDPAVYYGHPSVDLAMTTLFGGFHHLFYEAYNDSSPFPANYKEQWAVCNLYPLLVHLYLFGRSYLSQIEETLKRFS